jgi:hypothetical protein
MRRAISDSVNALAACAARSLGAVKDCREAKALAP